MTAGIAQKNPRCRNCHKGSHPPNSKQCPQWQKEKEIIEVGIKKKYLLPRGKLCEPKNTAGSVTYAQVAKQCL